MQVSTCIPVTDSKKENATINRMSLFLFSISHLPFAQTGDNFLREDYAFTILGEFNSAGSFLKPQVPPLPL